MNDFNATLALLKDQVRALCLRRGWGDEDGRQNPQQVAMAMTVEMAELLEHFQWLNERDVRLLMEGQNPEETAAIAEELADVMIYALQLSRTLGIDLTGAILRKIGIVDTRPRREDDRWAQKKR